MSLSSDVASDHFYCHEGGGGGDGVGDGSRGGILVVTQLLGGAAVGHSDVVTTAITTIIMVHEVKMVECQPDSTI